MVEGLRERGGDGPGQRGARVAEERRRLDDVHRQQAAGAQRPPRERGELDRRQVAGHPQVVEGVEDHDVREPVPPAQPALQEPAPVEGADPQLPRGAQAEVLARQPDERGVDLRDLLARPGPGRGDVAREREAAAAQVHGGDRPSRRRRDVDRVGQPADVGPGDAPRVAQVDVGGVLAVEPQHAPPGLLGVG